MSRKEKFQEKINVKYPLESLEVVEYTYAKQPATVKCLTCNSTYRIKGENFLVKDKSRVCSKCLPNKRKQLQASIETFIEYTLKQDLFEFNLEDLNIKGSNDLVPGVCKLCKKTNFKTMRDYKRGYGCSCVANNEKKSNEKFLLELPSDLKALEEYRGAHEKISIKHSCGFIWKTTPHNILSGKGCPKCNRKTSKGEQRIENFLKDNNIDYIKEYEVILEGHKLRTDFFLPDKNFHIEYNGIQHYKPVKHFGGQQKFEKQVELDKLKNKYLDVKTIKYTQYDEIENLLSLMFNDYPEEE